MQFTRLEVTQTFLDLSTFNKMTYELKNQNTGELYRLRIERDTDVQNPRSECDQVSNMVCFHSRYKLPNEGDYNKDYIKGWDDLEKRLVADGAIVILPVYMLDHSGLSVKTTSFTCGNAQWDSGQIGFIFYTKQALLENFGWKILTQSRLLKAADYLRAEIETYDQYLKGDVWGFTLEQFVPFENYAKVEGEYALESTEMDWDSVDSCWGFYGSDLEKNGILEHLPDWAQEQIKKQL